MAGNPIKHVVGGAVSASPSTPALRRVRVRATLKPVRLVEEADLAAFSFRDDAE